MAVPTTRPGAGARSAENLRSDQDQQVHSQTIRASLLTPWPERGCSPCPQPAHDFVVGYSRTFDDRFPTTVEFSGIFARMVCFGGELSNELCDTHSPRRGFRFKTLRRSFVHFDESLACCHNSNMP